MGAPGNGSHSGGGAGNSNNGSVDDLFGTEPLGLNGKDRINGKATGLASNA